MLFTFRRGYLIIADIKWYQFAFQFSSPFPKICIFHLSSAWRVNEKFSAINSLRANASISKGWWGSWTCALDLAFLNWRLWSGALDLALMNYGSSFGESHGITLVHGLWSETHVIQTKRLLRSIMLIGAKQSPKSGGSWKESNDRSFANSNFPQFEEVRPTCVDNFN